MKFELDNSMSFCWGLTQGTLESGGGGSSAFTSTWNTSRPGTSNSQQITLPLDAAGNYDFVVNWGDGTRDVITAWDDSAKTHTYNVSGNYVVAITGEIEGWIFNNTGDCQKLEQVSQWGPLLPSTGGSQFYGCLNMVVNAVDTLNTANVTNMTNMLRSCAVFNQDIGSWNTVNVTTMSSMFRGCTIFNQNIGSWNTANVTIMTGMFQDCAAFNQDIGSWNTVNVTTMSSMFYDCTNFNQNIGSWNMANVTAISNIFRGCTAFNQDIGSWNTAGVTSISNVFHSCTNFNQDIGSWDTANVISMSSMFYSCVDFDQDIGSWNVEALRFASIMFDFAELSTANYDSLLIGWATQTVISGVNFHGGGSQYSVGAATTARASLVTDGWTITDGGQAP